MDQSPNVGSGDERWLGFQARQAGASTELIIVIQKIGSIF